MVVTFNAHGVPSEVAPRVLGCTSTFALIGLIGQEAPVNLKLCFLPSWNKKIKPASTAYFTALDICSDNSYIITETAAIQAALHPQAENIAQDSEEFPLNNESDNDLPLEDEPVGNPKLDNESDDLSEDNSESESGDDPSDDELGAKNSNPESDIEGPVQNPILGGQNDSLSAASGPGEHVPQLNDIRVESHPSTGLAAATYSFEEYYDDDSEETVPASEPAEACTSIDHVPWCAFRTWLNFELAKVMQSSHLNHREIDMIISIVQWAVHTPNKFMLGGFTDLTAAWTAAWQTHAEGVSFVKILCGY